MDTLSARVREKYQRHILQTMESDMTQRYRKFRRSWGTYYAYDSVTGNSVNGAAGEGMFRLKESVEPALARWADRAARVRGDGETLQGIHREIVAVRKEFREMKTVKERLE